MRRSASASPPEGPETGPEPFAVTRDGPLSIHVQLLAQLKHHIEEHTWEAGVQLPPARLLAGSLGINTNTVRAVYRELEREGYVSTEQGRGTFVAESSPEAGNRYQRVYELLDEVVILAQRAGLSPDDLARIAFLRARIFTPPSFPVRLLFVECTEPDVEFHARTIQEGAGVEPFSVLLRDLPGKSADYLDSFDVLVTTLFHVTEVQRIVGRGRRVFTLTLEPSPDLVVARLIALAPGTRVAIVCTTRTNANKFVSSLLVRGLSHLRFLPVGLNDGAALTRTLGTADVIWASRAIPAAQKDAWARRKPVHDYVDVIDTTSLRLLRRFVAELASETSAATGRGPA